ncbi:maternal effect embryo arrest [Senna tora]|uniref:Maternal effect embryo arrest n=1 Tax=Senna tora TaxID=362788 RepID=A0A834SUB8_9FABA|nr:maternal effect embryo arrest [Senna tora]
MVGQRSAATKPSRSDEVLDAEEQEKIADQIRARFDSLAPKRPVKPSRSEPDPDASLLHHHQSADYNIPEHLKFQTLQSQSHAILNEEGSEVVEDEFVETQYYEELTSIDKQHHTTGSGFIRVAREGGEEEVLKLPETQMNGGETKVQCYKSNPAMNDWVPNIDEQEVFASSKPNRSESS